MSSEVLVFGPPQTVTEGGLSIRVVAAYAIGLEVGVLVDATGTQRPTPARGTDSFIVAVDVVSEAGETLPCSCVGESASASDSRALSMSSWMATIEPRRLRLTVRRPSGMTLLDLTPATLFE
jgi:hypothetical protein